MLLWTNPTGRRRMIIIVTAIREEITILGRTVGAATAAAGHLGYDAQCACLTGGAETFMIGPRTVAAVTEWTGRHIQAQCHPPGGIVG